MQPDDLSRLWKSQPDSLPGDLEEVLMNVKQRSRAFDRKIFRRDLSEGLAALFVAGIAFWASIQAPGWSPKLGAAVLTAACGFVYWRLHRTRNAHRSAADADLSVSERLGVEIAKVDAQVTLLRSVHRWYVSPLAIGGTVWVVATMAPSLLQLPAATILLFAAFTVGALALVHGAVGWWVIRLNRRAVEQQLLPYRRELEDLRQRLANA